MSADLKVFLSREQRWSPAQWQKQITDLGYPLSIDTDFDRESYSGFLPCRLHSEEIGFEYGFDPLEDTMFAPSIVPEIARDIGERDVCVSFSMQSNTPGELTAGVMAAAALAKLCNGIAWDGDFVKRDPVEWAAELIREYGHEAK
ncbi:MAG: hypothetical protein SF172_05425 [Burkholderiales bacterium]|nr:hypothetical protein [Burkholderiales bacterium]